MSNGNKAVSETIKDPLPRVGPTTITHLRFVREAFLPAVARRGLIASVQLSEELGFASRWEREGLPPSFEAPATRPTAEPPVRYVETPVAATAAPAAPPAAPEGAAPAPVPPAPVAPAPAVATVAAPAPRPVAAPAPRRPSKGFLWWARVRESVGTDLAAHGLAYVGVLLLFVGGFGLVAFAFGGVTPWMRPVSELVLALVPFAASWMLLRRDARIAGRALEVAGGLLLPIMIITSFLDGVAFPPDLTGAALLLTTTGLTLLVSLGYALWSWRRPESALRYLVAPTFWLAAALASMGIGQEIPSGKDVAAITAAQATAMALAMVATLAAARLRPSHRLSSPTITSTVVGGAVLALICVLTWVAESFPPVPVALTGLAGMAVLELLVPRLTARAVSLVTPLWWLAISLSLIPGVGLAEAAAVGAAGFLALLERHSAEPQPAAPFALNSGLLAAAAMVTTADPWWGFATMTALAAWAGVRRLHPYWVPRGAFGIDLVAGVLPLLAVGLLGRALDDFALAVLVGSAVALASVFPARIARPASWWRRDVADGFWKWWWLAGTLVATIAVPVALTAGWPLTTTQSWQFVAAGFALTASWATGPFPPSARSWAVTMAPVGTWLLLAQALDVSYATSAVGVGVVAVLGVALAHLLTAGAESWVDRGQLGLARHLAAIAAIAACAYQPTWSLAFTTGLATTGWILTAVLGELGRSPVANLLDRITPGLRFVPAGLAAIGLPATVAYALDASGVLTFGSAWAPALLAVTAVVYAAASWVPAGSSWRVTLGWLAPFAAIAAAATAQEPWPQVAGLAAVVAVALVTPAGFRPVFVPWLGWAAVTPLAGLSAHELWFSATSTGLFVTWTLAIGGSVLLLLAMAADLFGRAWTPVWRPARFWLVAPAVLGVAELGTAMGLAASALTVVEAGWILALAAGAVLALAALTRAGAVMGVGALLALAALLALGQDTFLASWWLALLAGSVLWAAAEVVNLRTRDLRWWVRADLPLVAVAHVTALTAAWLATDDLQLQLSLLGLGVLALAAAARLLRTLPLVATYGVVGAALVLSSAVLTGSPGWVSLALAFESLLTTALAVVTKGAVRTLLVAAGSVMTLGSWLYLTQWADWSTAAVVDTTTSVSALVAAGCALLYRYRLSDSVALLIRGGLSASTAVLAPFISWMLLTSSGTDTTLSAQFSWWTTAALAVTSVSLALVARRYGHGWLRDMTVVGLSAAVAEALAVVGATAWTQLGIAAGIALAADVAVVVLVRRENRTVWFQPVQLTSGLATVAGLVIALAAQPTHGLLPSALAVAAATVASEGVGSATLAPRVATPLLACAAWVALAMESLDSRPQWITIPIGLAVAVVTDLVRAWRHEHGKSGAGSDIAALDLVAVLFLVGYSFVQAVSIDILWSVLAAGLGAAVAYWGVFTKVRHRVVAGACTVAAALAVLVLVPLAKLLPQWTGVTLWVTIALVGLLAIVAATFLEQGRKAVHHAVDDFRRRTRGWE